jgi:hypothetical protein
MSPLGVLGNRPIAQIGILVRDLDRSLDAYSSLWDLGPWRIYTYGPGLLSSQTYRGGPARYSMRIALAGGTPQVELIEPLEGPSIYHEWLERRGEGLHHVAVLVESLAEATATMEAAGYAVLQSGAGFGPDGDGGFAYFDTELDLALIVEAIEDARRQADPERTYP